jgi:uncharacterized protein (TIGR03435 family)
MRYATKIAYPVFIAALMFIPLTHAQTPEQQPAFDVASIKPNKSGPQGAGGGIVPNGVNIVNLPLRAIIQLAYGIGQPSKVLNAPNWIVTERFDIIARAPERVQQKDIGRMLQAC